jgi:hypothetical protein
MRLDVVEADEANTVVGWDWVGMDEVERCKSSLVEVVAADQNARWSNRQQDQMTMAVVAAAVADTIEHEKDD